MKTKLLQCYLVLWIHNIDAICRIDRLYRLQQNLFRIYINTVKFARMNLKLKSVN